MFKDTRTPVTNGIFLTASIGVYIQPLSTFSDDLLLLQFRTFLNQVNLLQKNNNKKKLLQCFKEFAEETNKKDL